MSFDLKRYLVENKLTRLSRTLGEVKTEERKVALIRVTHKPSKRQIYTYTAEPGGYLKYTLNLRSKEQVIPDDNSFTNLMRQDNTLGNWSIDIIETGLGLDTARYNAAELNDLYGEKYKLGRKPKSKQVEPVQLAKEHSKRFNQAYYIKKTATVLDRYKNIPVDRDNTVTLDGEQYYQVLSPNVERV